MPVPEFYRFLCPTLQLHETGEVVALPNVAKAMANEFSITEEEQGQLLPSGRITRLNSRVYWALTYLRQALLLKSEGRGLNRITERGKKFLSKYPTVIKPTNLRDFSEFVAFQKKHTTPPSGSVTPDQATASLLLTEEEKTTPEEDIDTAYQILKDALAQEVLDRVKSMPPAFFEQLIVQLMLRLNYGSGTEDAGKTLGKSGDGGVDGVISQDKLGLDKIYLQAKRWSDGSVSSPDVQAFVGALSGHGASKGVFITTSTFTKPARDYARNNHNFKLSLVDGIELARLMIDHNLGVSLVQRYDVKRVDSDFFAGD